MSQEADSKIKEQAEEITFAEFLESVPPGSFTPIQDLVLPQRVSTGQIVGYFLNLPEIRLFCGNDACNGERFFRTTTTAPDVSDEWLFSHVKYRCSNCQINEKVFSLAVKRDGSANGSGYKLGELPNYGPPTPARLIKLIGPDRELFLRGRRCENQGLGIGAFVYYRRVVERQRVRIINQIIEVSRKMKAPDASIEALESAKSETQFSRAMDSIKQAIPSKLLVDGHNPMTLLHSALSDGLHDRSDERCLELATSIRLVLVELAERLGQALKDEAELKRAIGHIMNYKNG